MPSASRASSATSSGLNNSGRNSQPSRLKSSICCWVSFMAVPPRVFRAKPIFVGARIASGAAIYQSAWTAFPPNAASPRTRGRPPLFPRIELPRQELQHDLAKFLRRLFEHRVRGVGDDSGLRPLHLRGEGVYHMRQHARGAAATE